MPGRTKAHGLYIYARCTPARRTVVDLRIIQEFGNDVLASAGVDQAKKPCNRAPEHPLCDSQDCGISAMSDRRLPLSALCVSGELMTPGTELQELVLELSAEALRGKPRAAPASSFEASAIIQFLLQIKSGFREISCSFSRAETATGQCRSRKYSRELSRPSVASSNRPGVRAGLYRLSRNRGVRLDRGLRHLQAWLALLDFGMTPTLAREMSRFSAGAHDAHRSAIFSEAWRSLHVSSLPP